MITLLCFAVWSLISWVVLGWDTLPELLKAWIPRLLLIAAIVCVGAAPFLAGDYSEEVTLFIGGPYPYTVETVEGTYRLLAIGVGLALLGIYALGRWGARFFSDSPAVRALQLTFAVVALRIYIEKLGVPQDAAVAVGIIWLIVPLAVYFGVEAARAGSQRKFWSWAFGYTYGTRIFILALMLVMTHFQLGTHFDNSSVTRYTVFEREFTVAAHSWDQYGSLIVFPQLVLWPAVTLAVALLLGLPAYAIARRRLRK